jgi:hypothetical protein
MSVKQKILLSLISIIIVLLSCSKKTYTPPSELSVVDGELMMIGPVLYQDVLDQFPDWNDAEDDAEIKPEVVDGFTEIQTPLNIQCYIGTWCSDSRDGVPPFMKVLLQVDNPNVQIEFIGVDRRMDDPDHLARQNKIEKVPTFVVKMRNVEMFRMIEFPEITFQEDFLNNLINK